MNNEAKYELQIFASNQFGQIRTLMLEDVPWFAAVDVCNALEIGNSRQAVTRLDDDEKMTVTSNDSHSGQRGGAQMLILSILVDTFSSRILNPMLLPSGKRNIVVF